MAIRSSVESVTPALAEKILTDSKDQVKNRNVADCHVEWLSEQMKSGKWLTNGEPIIIDEGGFLLDGQHRLYAIVMSETTVETVVTRGVERSTFATIDTGASRTAGNVMSIAGELHSNTLASALGLRHRYDTGRLLGSARAAGFTSAISLALLKKHPTIREDVSWAVSMRNNVFLKRISGSALAFLRFMFSQHKPNKAAEFFDLVCDKRPDEHGTATRVFRDWLLKIDRRNPSTPLEVMAITVKAWAAFLSGERPKTYVWYRTTKFPESFPIFPGDKETHGKAFKSGAGRKDGQPSRASKSKEKE
jgi:hypothetical protein